MQRPSAARRRIVRWRALGLESLERRCVLSSLPIMGASVSAEVAEVGIGSVEGTPRPAVFAALARTAEDPGCQGETGVPFHRSFATAFTPSAGSAVGLNANNTWLIFSSGGSRGVMAHEAPSRSVDRDESELTHEDPLVPRGETKGWRGPNADVMEPGESEGGMIELSFQRLELPGTPRIFTQGATNGMSAKEDAVPNASTSIAPRAAGELSREADSSTPSRSNGIGSGSERHRASYPDRQSMMQQDSPRPIPSTDAYRAAVDAALGRDAEVEARGDEWFRAEELGRPGPIKNPLPRSLRLDPRYDTMDRSSDPFALGDLLPPDLHQGHDETSPWPLEGNQVIRDPMASPSHSPIAEEFQDDRGADLAPHPVDPHPMTDTPVEKHDTSDLPTPNDQVSNTWRRASEGGMVPLDARRAVPDSLIAITAAHRQSMAERRAAQGTQGGFDQGRQPAQMSANVELFRGVTLASLSLNYAGQAVSQPGVEHRLDAESSSNSETSIRAQASQDQGESLRLGWGAALVVPAAIAGQWWRRRRHHRVDGCD